MVAPYRPDEAAYQFWCDSAGKYNIRAYLCTAWLSPFVGPLGNLEVGDRYLSKCLTYWVFCLHRRDNFCIGPMELRFGGKLLLGFVSSVTTADKKILIFYMFSTGRFQWFLKL